MSDNEDLAKGLDAICIALRDISLRLKEAPDKAPERFVCPVDGQEFQSFLMKVTHMASKHPQWIVIRDPAKQAVRQAPETLESRFEPEPAGRTLIPANWLKKRQEYAKPDRKSWKDRDWTNIAVAVAVIGLIGAVIAAFVL